MFFSATSSAIHGAQRFTRGGGEPWVVRAQLLVVPRRKEWERASKSLHKAVPLDPLVTRAGTTRRAIHVRFGILPRSGTLIRFCYLE